MAFAPPILLDWSDRMIGRLRWWATAPGKAAQPPSTLCLTHTWGGGIAKALALQEEREQAASRRLLKATPKRPGSTQTRIDGQGLPVIEVNLLEASHVLTRVLEHLAIDRIEIHSTVGWPFRLVEEWPKAMAQLGRSYHVVLHDHTVVCPNSNLVSADNVYCGEEGEAQCRICLGKNSAQGRAVHPDLPADRTIDIASWRRAYAALLRGAQTVRAPSEDTARRIRSYWPDLAVTVAAPPDPDSGQREPQSETAERSGALVIGVLGTLTVQKGLHVVQGLCQTIDQNRDDTRIVLIGHAPHASFTEEPAISVTGPYLDEDLQSLILENKLDVIFLASISPETYSYTCSAAIRSGLPVLAFALGAQAERLAGAEQPVRLLPLDASPAEILQAARDLGELALKEKAP